MRPLLARRAAAVMLPFLLVFGCGAAADELPVMQITKTATCGCCALWVEHVEDAGFHVAVRDVSQEALANFKRSVGIAARHRSCHTARVGEYVIEGHVAAREIVRLLAERPDALGLAVPGMPLGSPGMDFDERRQRYATLLVTRDGNEQIFALHE